MKEKTKQRMKLANVDDCQNALLHIADDHPCCKFSLLAIRNTLLDLQTRHNALKLAAFKLVLKDFGSAGWDETCEQAARAMRSLFQNAKTQQTMEPQPERGSINERVEV